MITVFVIFCYDFERFILIFTKRINIYNAVNERFPGETVSTELIIFYYQRR